MLFSSVTLRPKDFVHDLRTTQCVIGFLALPAWLSRTRLGDRSAIASDLGLVQPAPGVKVSVLARAGGLAEGSDTKVTRGDGGTGR